jgi:DNA-directed RNA polymerase subunit H (RpoH/RPB5)
LYPEARIRSLVLHQIPGIKNIEVQVVLPGSLSIFVQKKSTIAAVSADKGYLLVAEDGEVLKKVDLTPSSLPLITFFEPIHYLDYQRGQTVAFSAIQKSLYFISVVQTQGLHVESVAIDSVDVIACKTRTVEILFSQSRDRAAQTNEITQVLQRLRVGDLKVTHVDLRFNKPVLELQT